MKLFVSSNLKKPHHLRFALLALNLFLMLFILSDLFLFLQNYGFSPKMVAVTLWGDEAAFIDPLSFDTLLQELHISLFFMALLFILLSALNQRLFPKSFTRRMLSLLLLLTMLFATLGLFIGYFHMMWALFIGYSAALLWHTIAIIIAIDQIRALK